MARLLGFLLIVSFIGALFFYGSSGIFGFLETWFAALLVILQHIFFVLLDFLRGAVLLLINTVRELFGF